MSGPISSDPVSRPTPADLDEWVRVMEGGKSLPGMLKRVISAYQELYGVFLAWADDNPPIEVQRVQFMPRVLDVDMSGGPRWRLPAVWLEGKLTFLRELGLLEYCPKCSRVHPEEFTCEGEKRGDKNEFAR